MLKITNNTGVEQTYELDDGTLYTLGSRESAELNLKDPESVENKARKFVGAATFEAKGSNSDSKEPAAEEPAPKVVDKSSKGFMDN